MSTATLDRTSEAEFKISVTLSPDDYQAPAKAELKRLAKGAKIKGFRPGKVPAAYMKKMYGTSVIADAISKAVDTKVNEVIKENELEIFGQLKPLNEPNLENLTADFAEEITFEFAGGLFPKVDTVDLTALKTVGRYTVALSDEEAAEKVDNARKRFMEYLEREDIETENDFATLVPSDEALDAKFIGTAAAAHSAEPAGDEETEEVEKESDPRQRYFLRPSDLVEDQRNKLIGKKKGTQVILANADLKDEVKSRFEKAIDGDATTTFTIAKVDRENLPELNEDTFKKIFGEQTEVGTEEEAKAEFSRRFAENSQTNLDDFALEQVIDALATSNEVALPEEAMKQRLVDARAEELAKAEKEGRQPEFDHELTEADRHGLARRLKWLAYRQYLLQEYKVELDAEDVDAGLERQYVQQIGGMGLDPEQYREQFFPMFKKNFLENREQVMEMTDGLLNKKLLAKLEEEGILGERKHVGEKEFGELAEAYNERVNKEVEALRDKKL